MKHENSKTNVPIEPAVRSVRITRLASGAQPEKTSDQVIAEEAVTIMIDKVGSFTVMCTPCDIEALAVGFVYSEALIDSIDDIVTVSTKENLPNVVGIQVENPGRLTIKRNLIIASSCGMCGSRNIEKMLSDIVGCPTTMQLPADRLTKVIEQMRSMQKIFRATGGSHAAAVFTSDSQIVSFAEDLGRHNALDKAIGKCLLSRLALKGLAVALSGRVSLEMVFKAARAGIEVIVAVSAPSSLAIEAAQRANITLCGFVRIGRANIYTHPERITDLRAET